MPNIIDLTAAQMRVFDENVRNIGLGRQFFQGIMSDLARDGQGRWLLEPAEKAQGGVFMDIDGIAGVLKAYEGDRLDPNRRPTAAFVEAYRRAMADPMSLFNTGTVAPTQSWNDLPIARAPVLTTFLDGGGSITAPAPATPAATAPSTVAALVEPAQTAVSTKLERAGDFLETKRGKATAALAGLSLALLGILAARRRSD